MNKNKIKFLITETALILACLTITACKTVNKSEVLSNLSILVLDENDRAVPDYQIKLQKNKMNDDKSEISETTNESGLCIFYDLQPAEYLISGKKSGYTQMPVQSMQIDRHSDLYCFRVYSAGFVLDEAESLYDTGEYEPALEFLQTICTERNQSLQNTVCFYKAYGYASLGQKEKAGIELQRLKELDSPAFETSRYSEAIEKMIFVKQKD